MVLGRWHMALFFLLRLLAAAICCGPQPTSLLLCNEELLHEIIKMSLNPAIYL